MQVSLQHPMTKLTYRQHQNVIAQLSLAKYQTDLTQMYQRVLKEIPFNTMSIMYLRQMRQCHHHPS